MDLDVIYDLEIEEDDPFDLEIDGDEPLDMELDAVYEAGAATDYRILTNKPRINGVELVGDRSSAELGIDRTYVHAQSQAADVWTIAHGLGKFPSVTVVDSAGSVVTGDLRYPDEDTVVVTFRGGFSGTAYLN